MKEVSTPKKVGDATSPGLLPRPRYDEKFKDTCLRCELQIEQQFRALIGVQEIPQNQPYRQGMNGHTYATFTVKRVTTSMAIPIMIAPVAVLYAASPYDSVYSGGSRQLKAFANGVEGIGDNEENALSLSLAARSGNCYSAQYSLDSEYIPSASYYNEGRASVPLNSRTLMPVLPQVQDSPGLQRQGLSANSILGDPYPNNYSQLNHSFNESVIRGTVSLHNHLTGIESCPN